MVEIFKIVGGDCWIQITKDLEIKINAYDVATVFLFQVMGKSTQNNVVKTIDVPYGECIDCHQFEGLWFGFDSDLSHCVELNGQTAGLYDWVEIEKKSE